MSNISNRLRSVLDYRQQKTVVSSLPPLLHVELTNACNLECPMCPRTTDMERRVGYMSLELVDKIADEAKGKIELVTLQFMGESILHPDFDKIIKAFKSRGIKTLLSTNANLLNEKRQEQLIQSGLDFVVFSLDAATSETYDKVRPGGDYDITVKNVEECLRKIQERKVKMFCVLQMIYMLMNKDEVSAFKEKWEKLGAHVWIKPYSVWNGEDDVKNSFQPEPEKVAHRDNVCDWPWRQMLITWTGDVVACCNDYDGKVKFGNVQQNTLQEVWFGDRLQAFRAAHIKGRETVDFCKKCPYISLGTAKQGVFVLFEYLTTLKIQTAFENYFKKPL